MSELAIERMALLILVLAVVIGLVALGLIR